MNSRDVRRAAWMLGLQTAALLFGCVVLVSITVYGVVERSAAASSRQELRNATINVDKPAEAPLGIKVVIDKDGTRLVSEGLPPGFPIESDLDRTRVDGQAREREVVRAGDHYLVRTELGNGRLIQAVYDEEEFEAERRRLIVALLVAGGFAVVLSAIAGAVLARRSLHPLVASFALQRRFIADASHELRTPLTLLSTRVQLLARQLRRRGVHEVDAEVAGVLSDTRRLGEILEDLLVAADPRQDRESGPVDVPALIAEVVDATTASATERGLEIRTEGASTGVVDGTESALRRAVLALVDNALDHADSVVVVRLEIAGHWCRIQVQDDGPGIDPAVLPRMFERFASVRSENAVRRHYGLGLALVADVAAAHGGRVEAGQAPSGSGAVLTLSLPVLGRGPR